MKLKKHILAISLVIFLFLLIGAVSAADIDTNDTQTVSASNNDEIIKVENDLDNLKDTAEGTYSDLKTEIESGSENIKLNKSKYVYGDGDGDTIEITNSIVIDGNGAVIDMQNSGKRAFNVTASYLTIKNLTIMNSKYDGAGGAIQLIGSSIIVENCNFINNNATFGGAVYLDGSGTLTDCNFINNNATFGGAVYFDDSGTLTNCNFNNNTASNLAGAVYVGGSGTVENCDFTDNAVSGDAGAIWLNTGSTVKNCNFISNSAFGDGGAIWMVSNSVENCNFTNNKANINGGAVYFHDKCTVTNCNFTGNNASAGSAIYFHSSLATTVSNSLFLNNRANADSIEVTESENNLTITFTGQNNLINAIYSEGNVAFTNVVYWSAEGITNTGSSTPSRSNKQSGQNITVEVYDSNDKLVDNVTLITDNNGQDAYDFTKLDDGNYTYKAYHSKDSYYTYTENIGTFNLNSTFNRLQEYINKADANSVLTLYRDYAFLVGVDENLIAGIVIDKPITINGNGYTINANGKARIFNIAVDNVILTNITFANANASGDGGAIYFSNSGTLTNCNFINNSASKYGGAIWMNSGSIDNCDFTGNNANRGSAIYFMSTPASKTISNSRFLNNRANAESLEVTKNENDLTITLTGWNTLFNAIYSIPEVTFTNVTYWGAEGIANTDSFAPSKSDKEAGQNITVEVYDSNRQLVENVTLVTDNKGQVKYDLIHLGNGNYTYKAYHSEDSYYTFVENNGTFTLGDFTSLQKYIRGADAYSVLTLYRDYIFTAGVDENLTGGIVIDEPITINGNGHTINALQKARIFNITADNVVLNNITFTNANVSGNGGAIYSSGSLNVENCNFTDNTAILGGAAYFYGEGSMLNCNFDGNTASSDGGALYFDDEYGLSSTVINCNFTGNSASHDGGAVYFNSKMGTIKNCNFIDNSASNSGAVYFGETGYVTNCNFSDNSASYGSALFLYFNGNVTDCNFINNTASNHGGAVYFLNNGNVSNCNFVDNSASRDGGAIIFDDCGTVTDCNFVDNSASGDGGAINMNSGTVENCNFTGNNAKMGSAIYFRSISRTERVSNSLFLNNRANVEELQVIKNENNLTIIFTGCNNLLNAIYSFIDVNFANVTYWGANGIANTGNSTITLSGSDMEAGQNITVEIYGSNGQLVDNVTLVTDNKGQVTYDFLKLGNGNYTYKSYHSEDSYYTYAENNGTFTLGDFTSLQKYLNGADEGSVLTLYRNYTFTVGADENLAGGIVIDKPITINGNGYTIDAKGKARIFDIRSIGVVLENITFVNGNTTDSGGAVYFSYSGDVINCNFTGNTANQYGGAVYFLNKGNVSNCNFTGNSASGDGGAVYFIEMDSIVLNCKFTGNSASGDGGAVYFMYNGEMINCNFINNTASGDGGAINMGSGTVSNCNFTGNTANHDGGAVYFEDESTVTNCNFEGNKATGSDSCGGAVYFYCEYTISSIVINCNFTGNSASRDGGAVCFIISGSVENCNFNNNTAGYGGAINFNNDGTVTNCNFTGNSASGDGGAVYFEQAGNVAGSRFTNNTANGDGGAVYFLSEGTVSNCNLTGNHANYGGAVYFKENGAVENCNFTGNIANRSGGAVWMNSGNVTGCSFADNAAIRDGGAVKMYFGNVTDCDFAGNGAIRDGGAVYIKENGAVENCNFTDNTAVENGGAVYLNNESNVINCNFTNNAAFIHGGAVDIYSGNISNCNFNNNTVTTMGGAVYSYAQSNITNCNFTDNKADYSGGALGLNGDSKVSNTNFKNNVAGDGSNDIVTTNNATVTLENVSPENVTSQTQVDLYILVNNVTYPSAVEIKVNVTENHKGLNEGSVYVVINNKTYAADVVNGTAVIKIPNLTAANYNDVKVTYNGSGKYTKSYQLVSFTVLKQTTAITAAAKTYVINYGGKYSVTLKDSKGNAVAGKTVTITINGKNYKAVSGSNGVATFGLTKAMLKSAGTNVVTIKFAGDINYAASTTTAKIKVKKESVKILKAKKTYKFKKTKKSKNIKVTLKNSKNKAMKKVKVTIKLSGKKIKGKKKITAKTNKNGVVKFKLGKKLTKKTKIKYTITYNGNSYYNKVTKKGKIIIK